MCLFLSFYRKNIHWRLWVHTSTAYQHTDTDAVSTDTAYLFQGMLYPLPRYVLFSLYSVRLRKPCPLFCFTQAHDIIIVESITGCLVMQTVGVQLLWIYTRACTWFDFILVIHLWEDDTILHNMYFILIATKLLLHTIVILPISI